MADIQAVIAEMEGTIEGAKEFVEWVRTHFSVDYFVGYFL